MAAQRPKLTVGNFPIAGKIAVITGAGSGICLATAQRFHQEGCHVLLADLRLTPEAESWIKTIDTSRVKAVFQKTDVEKWDELQELIPFSEKEFGDVPDIYVLGAAIFEPSFLSNWWEDTESTSYKLLSINVGHVLKTTRIAIQALVSKNKKGVILIVSSLTGYTPFISSPLYVASKHATVGFTRCLAELDDLEGIKVVASCPGRVKTRMWTDNPDLMKNTEFSDETAMTSEEYAESMIALTEEAKYPGGTVLEVSKRSEWRVVPTFNAPPPAGVGTAPSMDKSLELILKGLANERGSKLSKKL